MRYCVAARSTRDNILLEVPDFGASFTYDKMHFDGLPQVRAEMRRVLLECIQRRMKAREAVPQPSADPSSCNLDNKSWGRRYKAKWVRLSYYVSIKVVLYQGWQESKVSETDLCRRSGLSRVSVRNMWVLENSMNLTTVQSVLDGLGMVAETRLMRIKR